MYDGSTADKLYEGESQDSFINFPRHIHPLPKYSFSVKIIAPSIFQKIANGYMKVELESQEATILCYSKPTVIEGKIKTQNLQI